MRGGRRLVPSNEATSWPRFYFHHVDVFANPAFGSGERRTAVVLAVCGLGAYLSGVSCLLLKWQACFPTTTVCFICSSMHLNHKRAVFPHVCYVMYDRRGCSVHLTSRLAEGQSTTAAIGRTQMKRNRGVDKDVPPGDTETAVSRLLFELCLCAILRLLRVNSKKYTLLQQGWQLQEVYPELEGGCCCSRDALNPCLRISATYSEASVTTLAEACR